MPLQTRPGVLIRDAGELVLSDLEVVHSGNYSCTVQGSIGRATGTAILTVEDPLFSSGAPSFAPSITSPTPPTQVLPLKQTAQFVCLVEGFPPPQVIWLRNGKPQPNFRRVTLLNESLSIRDLRSTDKGTYECVATNALGEERLRFQLTIPGEQLQHAQVQNLQDLIISLLSSSIHHNTPPAPSRDHGGKPDTFLFGWWQSCP